MLFFSGCLHWRHSQHPQFHSLTDKMQSACVVSSLWAKATLAPFASKTKQSATDSTWITPRSRHPRDAQSMKAHTAPNAYCCPFKHLTVDASRLRLDTKWGRVIHEPSVWKHSALLRENWRPLKIIRFPSDFRFRSFSKLENVMIMIDAVSPPWRNPDDTVS